MGGIEEGEKSGIQGVVIRRGKEDIGRETRGGSQGARAQ